ncbi:MAG: hypothetical protein QW692_00110 [Nitrososphaerota archaeon]
MEVAMLRRRSDRDEHPKYFGEDGGWSWAPHKQFEIDDNDGGSGLLNIIRKKRHLLNDCFEDENFNVEPC